nr:flavodoxin domain-containing protein [Pseudomarimonas arenosa]
MLLTYLTWCFLLLSKRRRSQRGEHASPEPAGTTWLLAYASQTGTAVEIAQRSAAALRGAGQAVDLRDLGSVNTDDLRRASRALFVVATTGEGEAPESAQAFVHRVMAQAQPLPQLRSAVLALGDREYPQFCAFGHALQAWLQQAGSQVLQPLIEVDAGEPVALARWHTLLQSLAGKQAIELVATPRFERWTLEQRVVMNPGSLGLPIHLLRLRPTSAIAPWQPGAIATIKLQQDRARVRAWLEALVAQGADYSADQWQMLQRQAQLCRLPSTASCRGLPFADLIVLLLPLPQRNYSIASTAADGVIDLLLRETRTPQGELGLGAAWLCQACAIGETVDLHVRENRQFGLPPDSAPLILIGAGTGIAGLRALLRGRMQRGSRPNWLIFGERQRSRDALFDTELQAALQSGGLQHLDQVYSRDGGEIRHVQDLLAAQAQRLCQWIEQGAHLRICGSADTMGKAVDQQLQALLGSAALAALTAEGRCRKDVY